MVHQWHIQNSQTGSGTWVIIEINDRRRPDLTAKNMPNLTRELLLDISIASPTQNSANPISRNQALNRGRLANRKYL